MLQWRHTSIALLALILLDGGSLFAEERRSPLHGSLTAGPHAVGFTTVAMSDATRPQAGGPRARDLVVHVWYPAARGATAPAMTFGDALVTHLAGARPSELEARETATRRFMEQFGPVTDAAWAGLRQTPLLAQRDVPPASGRFPLVIGQLRPTSTAITNEYLASHGYVVAMTFGLSRVEPRDPGAGLEIAYRDMEFAIPQLRTLPYVDPVALAALGFSGAGFSQILLAMRHPDVRAVCDLESAIFDDRLMWPLARGWGYDVAALRVPFLHTYSVPLSKLESRIGDFEAMRYSQRFRYLVDAPGIHHWDFATEGMAASAVLKNRGEHSDRLRQAFETTNRYVLAFFNAFVKGDAAELAYLRRDPQANGAPAGLASIKELPFVQPAPSTDAFVTMMGEAGVEKGMAAFEAARAADPQAPLFTAAELNQIGYRLLRQQKSAEAIAIFRKAVALYPATANPYDSLSEALESAGDRAGALDVARKGLEVVEKEDLPAARRQQLKDLLGARVKRLDR